MTLWLVERYLGTLTEPRLRALADETRGAVDLLRARGISIDYLGSTAIPGDETCFCLFDAADHEAVEQANAGISVPALRIVDALAVGEQAR